MVLDSISIEHFKVKDLNERKASQNDMESSASVPKSPPRPKPTDLNLISTVTPVPKTKMASPSMPQFPTAPVSNHADISETTLSPRNIMNAQLYPSANSFYSQSTCMGDRDSCHEETANTRPRDALPCNLINTSAVMLPSMPPIGKKSPTYLPNEPKESNSPLSFALLDRNSSVSPSVSANNSKTGPSVDFDLTTAVKVDEKETATTKLSNESTIAMPQSDFHVAKSTMGLVLTCHDRLETVLTPKNIIEYKSMDVFASPTLTSNNKVCKNMDGMSKQASQSTPVPKSNMASLASLPQNGKRSAAASTPQNNLENCFLKGPIRSVREKANQSQTVTKSPSQPNTDHFLTGSTHSRDWTDSSELPSMAQTNMAATKSLDPTFNVVEVAPTDKIDLKSKGRPDRLDLPQAKSSSKSSSGDKLVTRNSSAALSQNRIKIDQTKRSIESPTKPKIITKSPSRDKMDKKLFRYSIGVLPGSPQIKMEDSASVPKATVVLPSKPKTITKSPSVDKVDKRLIRSTTEVSSMPQTKMVEKASVPKTNMASPTKPRTISKSPSTNNIFAKNTSELPQMQQTKMAVAGSLPQLTLTSPTKPKTLSKSPSVDKIATKKLLRKEKSCPAESSPVVASERRPSLKPPWRGGAWTPSRSQTSLSLAQSGFIRRSESSMSVNAGLRSRAGLIRPATSLPHIPKSSSSRPCLLVALRPTNLQQERERFFQSQFRYEPQFEYEEAELSAVLDKYREGSDLFLQQAVGIMECVLRKYGSYENFEEVTGGNVLPKSQVWAAVRKYLQKEGCVGEVVVRLSDELLSQAVMVVENCRPTLTINLAGARQHWLEGMLRHEIGTHYLRGVNNNLQPWASSEHRKALGLKGANPTEEGLASLHSVLLRRQPHLWRAALLYYTVHHAASMSFSQLFHHIQRFVDSPDVRWEYCLRAKRGQTDTSKPGCFSKDQVYLDGILRLLRHRRTIDFQLLTALGKVSFEDVERLRPLAVLSRTRIPHFMADTDRYLSQLDHILSTNDLSDEELQQLLP